MEQAKSILVNTTAGAVKAPLQEQPQKAPRKRQVKALENTIPAGQDKCIIVVRPQTNRDNEMRTYRIAGVPYTVKTGVPVEVPQFLAEHIMDLVERKKISAQLVQKYAGDGVKLGELG